jgi:hypothetical protein
MILMPYATVIVGAMPIKLRFLTGGAMLLNEGARPTILNDPVATCMVLDNTIFKNPPSLYTVPGLKPIGLVGSANNVN